MLRARYSLQADRGPPHTFGYVTGTSRFVDNSRAAIVGEGATELIHHGQAVLHLGGTLDYFIHATFDVPTMSDSYKYAAYDCLQHMGTADPDRSRSADG